MCNIDKIFLLVCLVFGFYYGMTKETVETAPLAVKKEVKTFEELIKVIPPAFNVPDHIVDILILKESGGNMQAIRFEEHLVPRVKKKYKVNDHEAMNLSSSHCAMQILGLHAKERGFHWSKLYEPETCIETAMAIWKSGYEKCSEKHGHEYDRLYCAAKRYNGGDEYARDFMKILNRKVLEKGLV